MAPSCTYTLKCHATTFYWKLEDFLLLRTAGKTQALPSEDGESLRSANMDGLFPGDWWIEMTPYWKQDPDMDEDFDVGNVAVFLCSNVKTDVYVRFCINIVAEECGDIMYLGGKFSKKFGPNGVDNLGTRNLIRGDERIFRKRLTVDGALILQILLRVYAPQTAISFTKDDMPNFEKGALFYKDLSQYFQSSAPKDVELVCRNTTSLFANGAILSARSKVFNAALNGGFRESKMHRIEVPDTKPSIMENFVDFAETDDCKVLSGTASEIVELMEAADRYASQSLIERCAAILKTLLDPSNIVQIMAVAKQCQCEDLVAAGQKYLRNLNGLDVYLSACSYTGDDDASADGSEDIGSYQSSLATGCNEKKRRRCNCD